MAHFARVVNNAVAEVIVVRNEDCGGGDDEAAGQAFIASIGLTGRWLQCSYNTRNGRRIDGTDRPQLRFNYPGIGSLYDPETDHFIAPEP